MTVSVIPEIDAKQSIRIYKYVYQNNNASLNNFKKQLETELIFFRFASVSPTAWIAYLSTIGSGKTSLHLHFITIIIIINVIITMDEEFATGKLPGAKFFIKIDADYHAYMYLQITIVRTNIVWGLNIIPPRDVPVCGFLNQSCPASVYTGKSTENTYNLVIFLHASCRVNTYLFLKFF